MECHATREANAAYCAPHLNFKKLHIFPDGGVYNKQQNQFIPQFIHNNYMCIAGNYGPIAVHRLVASKYCSGRHRAGRQDMTVDHIDADKNNNQAENLRWMSRSENLMRWRMCQKHEFRGADDTTR